MSVLEEQQGGLNGWHSVNGIMIGDDLRGVGREWSTDYIGLVGQ